MVIKVITKHIKEKKVIRSKYEFIKEKSCLNNLIAFYDGMAGWVDGGRAADVV